MSNDNLIPNVEHKGFDIKQSIILKLNETIHAIQNGEVEGLAIGANTSVKILLNMGMVSGTLAIFDEAGKEQMIHDNDIGSLLISNVIEGVDEAVVALRSELGEKLNTINTTGTIILKDAIITPYANSQVKFHVANLAIFTDQILGVTFGEEG